MTARVQMSVLSAAAGQKNGQNIIEIETFQLTDTIEKRYGCQLFQFKNQRPLPLVAADFYGLDNKTSFSYPRGYYLK